MSDFLFLLWLLFGLIERNLTKRKETFNEFFNILNCICLVGTSVSLYGFVACDKLPIIITRMAFGSKALRVLLLIQEYVTYILSTVQIYVNIVVSTV